MRAFETTSSTGRRSNPVTAGDEVGPWVWTSPQRQVWFRWMRAIAGEESSLSFTFTAGCGIRVMMRRLQSLAGGGSTAIETHCRWCGTTAEITIERLGRSPLTIHGSLDGSAVGWVRRLPSDAGPHGVLLWPPMSVQSLERFVARTGWAGPMGGMANRWALQSVWNGGFPDLRQVRDAAAQTSHRFDTHRAAA